MTNDLRAKILGATDMKRKPVDVREWGCTVYVKTLTGAERDAFEASLVHKGSGRAKNAEVNMLNMRAKLVAACCVDKEGNLIFRPDDVEALGAKSARALGRVFDQASQLNGLSQEDIEELAGNSEPDPSGNSTSASPSPSEKPSGSSSPKSTPAS